jgi:hypothetical protein
MPGDYTTPPSQRVQAPEQPRLFPVESPDTPDFATLRLDLSQPGVAPVVSHDSRFCRRESHTPRRLPFTCRTPPNTPRQHPVNDHRHHREDVPRHVPRRCDQRPSAPARFPFRFDTFPRILGRVPFNAHRVPHAVQDFPLRFDRAPIRREDFGTFRDENLGCFVEGSLT